MHSKIHKFVKHAALAVAVGTLAAMVVILAGGSVSAAPVPNDPLTCTEAAAAGLLEIPPSANKVTLCHFTGSTSNPFIINQPSLSAADNHAGHHGDCVRFFNGTILCGL